MKVVAIAFAAHLFIIGVLEIFAMFDSDKHVDERIAAFVMLIICWGSAICLSGIFG